MQMRERREQGSNWQVQVLEGPAGQRQAEHLPPTQEHRQEEQQLQVDGEPLCHLLQLPVPVQGVHDVGPEQQTPGHCQQLS